MAFHFLHTSIFCLFFFRWNHLIFKSVVFYPSTNIYNYSFLDIVKISLFWFVGIVHEFCFEISWGFLKKDFIYLFLERGEGKEKERERNINVWLPLTCPLLGTWPTTQTCALTGNWTCDPLGLPLSHTRQGFWDLLNPNFLTSFGHIILTLTALMHKGPMDSWLVRKEVEYSLSVLFSFSVIVYPVNIQVRSLVCRLST